MALSIGRKPLESVTLILPDNRRIVVTYMAMTGRERIRLSFDAPRDVQIFRNELLKPAGGDGAGAA
jgi:sRNA-binding carbon storage regulator CsrA